MGRMEPAIRDYLNKMRNEAFIQVKQGYVDSGATYAELHPSIAFSAYVPPSPKKKAKAERTRFRESTRTFRQKSGAAAAGTDQVAAGNHAGSDTGSCQEGQRRKNKSRRKARQEGKDPLRTGAARDSAHGRHKLPTEDAGAVRLRHCRRRLRVRSSPRIRWSPLRPRRGRASANARAEKKPKTNAVHEHRKWACAAGCGRSGRPGDAVRAFGPERNDHAEQEEEEGIGDDSREDAHVRAEEESRRCEPQPPAADADSAGAGSPAPAGTQQPAPPPQQQPQQ